jgi:hypothetical protein
MYTRRPSDAEWVKYLLNTGLMSVDQYQTMKGGQNQIDLTDLFLRNASIFDDNIWVNKALQQDRFSYIPAERLDPNEIETFRQSSPLVLAKLINEQIIPVSYHHQMLFLGLLRYDTEFTELTDILGSISHEIDVHLIPLGTNQFSKLWPAIRSLTQR